jgi:hypothetical protein
VARESPVSPSWKANNTADNFNPVSMKGKIVPETEIGPLSHKNNIGNKKY